MNGPTDLPFLFAVSPLDVVVLVLLWAPVVLACTLVGLFPAWAVREALADGAETIARTSGRVRQAARGSDALAFARRLRTHRWSVATVTTGAVFLLVTAAGLLSVLVAGNVVGLQRPAVGEAWLPWILGGALLAILAEAWPSRGQPGFGLRVITVSSAFVAVVIVAILKAEATTIPPAEYARYHPFKDWLLGPFWVALEAAFFLGGAVLGRPGIECGMRALGWLVGLGLETAIQLGLALVVAVLAITRAVLVALRLLISALFLPAALLWAAVRKAAGTDLDGNPRLVGLPTGHQVLKGDAP